MSLKLNRCRKFHLKFNLQKARELKKKKLQEEAEERKAEALKRKQVL
jgi:hypothetical protein